MIYREKLELWVWDAVNQLGGSATVVEVARLLWQQHEKDFRDAGDRFYNWQYDMRWAAQELRKKQKLAFRKEGSKSIWFVR